jgi:hypothetical protein
VPICTEVASTAASWSSKIVFVSNSRRPIRVDLPSSTLPQVSSRSSSSRRLVALEVRVDARPVEFVAVAHQK